MFEPEDLLQPLPGPDPCGPDLSYDPQFLELEAAACGKEEQRIGHAVRPAVAPDWSAVRRLALSLFERTRDLRVAMYLLRAELHLEGPGALGRGLRLAAGLLRRYGHAVHPRAEDDEGMSPEQIAGLALAPIDRNGSVIADLLALPVGDPSLGVKGRDIARVPERPIDDLMRALRDEQKRTPGLAGELDAALDALREIQEPIGYELAGLGVPTRVRSWLADSIPDTVGQFIDLLADAARQARYDGTEPACAGASDAASWAVPEPAPVAKAAYPTIGDRLRGRVRRATERAPFADIDALLAPIDSDAPCGPNLEYDAEFTELELTVRPPRAQMLDETLKCNGEPDWPIVRDRAYALLGRTKDLRVAVYLSRATTRLAGIEGAAFGLRLIDGLLASWWECVHPALDPDDNDDPTLRLNALAPLADADALLGDLRAIGLGRNSIAARSVELSHTGAPSGEPEAEIDDAAIGQALRDEAERCPDLLERAREALDAATSIEETIATRCPAATDTLNPLLAFLRRLVGALERVLRSEAQARDEGLDRASRAAPGAHARAARAPQRTPSEEEMLKTLEAVCEWIERDCEDPARECRRASRLMARRFGDLARDLTPDSQSAIEDYLSGGGR